MPRIPAIDADGHVQEPEDAWEQHIAAKWRSYAPRTVRDDRGPLRGTRAEEESFMKRIAIVWTAALVGCVGCASASYRVAHVELDPAKYEPLGYAEGRATWVLILNIIPFGRPDQIQRAMEDAIESKHGEEIVDVTIEESWFLNGFSVHLNGMVVRKRDSERNQPQPGELEGR
jgi:hypothetical protein